MSARTSELLQLARAYGVQSWYLDMNRVRRYASVEALVGVLRALGAPLEDATGARNALAARRADLAKPGIAPVYVAWNGRLDALALRLPRGRREAAVHVNLEGGGSLMWTARTTPGLPLARLHRTKPLPPGYHSLEVDVGGVAYTALVIAAPRRAHVSREDRTWGVFLPLYAFASQRGWGIGDYTALGDVVDWTVAHGGSFAGTLPLLATFLDEPFEPSPYAPVSRLFWNELFIDLDEAPGARPAADAPPEARRSATEADLVNYRRIAAARRPLLTAAADAFFAAGGEREETFQRFLALNPDSRAYARFRAVCDRLRAGWHDWPAKLRAGTLTDGDFAPADERRHLYAAWLADAQLGRAAAPRRDGERALYLDLPLGVHREGFDTWREPAIFADGVSAGAPPDSLFTLGQNWGFPPLRPAALRDSGYRYVRAVLRQHLRHAGVLRLDHAMSLQRLFWIPDGLPATEGVYVHYPTDELIAILTLESVRHDAVIVGEDLGTVSREIRTALDRHAIRRMFVVQFEASPDRDPPVPDAAPAAVASLNTHDMPPFAAFWAGLDIDDQRDLGLLDDDGAAAARARRALLRSRIAAGLDLPRAGDGTASAGTSLHRLLARLASSTASMMIVNVEDLWLETRAQNVPGTSSERPNWRRRARYDVAGLTTDPAIARALDEINCLRQAGKDHG